MARGKAKSMNSMKFITLMIVIACILGFGFGSAYAIFNESLLDEGGTKISNLNKYDDTLVDADDESINFLFAGVDESHMMTDVIILINLNEEKKTINVMQIPRDTYIGDDEVPTGKINAAYSNPRPGEKNIEGLLRTINTHFKVSIDHYATFTLDDFKHIINIMGGIEVDIPYRVEYDANLGMIIDPGPQVLMGDQAEWFIRYRKGYNSGDIGRLDAQVVFLKAMIDKLFNITAGQAVEIATKTIARIKTDMALKDVTGYYSAVKKIGKDGIHFFRVPGEGVSPAYNGYATFGVDTDELAKILNENFRPNSPPVPPEELGLTSLEEMQAVEDANGGSTYGPRRKKTGGTSTTPKEESSTGIVDDDEEDDKAGMGSGDGVTIGDDSSGTGSSSGSGSSSKGGKGKGTGGSQGGTQSGGGTGGSSSSGGADEETSPSFDEFYQD